MVDRIYAVGRLGYGAICGAKNLKAIVISGEKAKDIVDAERLSKLRKEFAKKLKNSTFTKTLSKYGTAGFMKDHNEMGNLPTKNFQDGQYFYYSKINGQALVKSDFWVKSEGCLGCPVKCKQIVKGIFNNRKFGPGWGGPEYETIAAFGSNMLNNDLKSICLFNKLCNQYGLDTISVGVQISYLMEATEKGLLKKEDQINWGDTKKILELVDKIANRKGIGDWIARGVEFISNKIGDGSFLIHSKGQEIPMHDPRGKYSMAVYYATTPRGGNHMEGTQDPNPPQRELNLPNNPARSWENRAKISGEYLKLRSFVNSLILCAFTALLVDDDDYQFPLIRKMLGAISGRNIGVKEMLNIGERNYDLLRIFAEKAGYRRDDDKLHKRFYESQPSTGYFIDKKKLDYTIDEYYKIYGYDKYGPSKERAKYLNIDEGII